MLLLPARKSFNIYVFDDMNCVSGRLPGDGASYKLYTLHRYRCLERVDILDHSSIELIYTQ
jgi:hypothetical protein